MSSPVHPRSTPPETILVTGTGGGAGQSVLKALQRTEYRVLAADGEVLGTGLYAAAKGFVIPYARASDFVGRLLEICAREQVRLLFPGLDAELPVLSLARQKFAAINTTVVVSEPHIVHLCDDKKGTADFLREEGLPYPRTWLMGELISAELPCPLVVKPRLGGARSQGVRVIRDEAAWRNARTELDPEKYIAQEWIDGPEYTCGTLSLPGAPTAGIVLRRILRDGDTYKAFVERDPALESFVCELARRLQPFGPCNVQLRVRDGQPLVFELNGRCSGTTYARALAGFNEPAMIADYLLHGTLPAHEVRPLTVLRYWKELAVENDAVQACETDREVISPSLL